MHLLASHAAQRQPTTVLLFIIYVASAPRVSARLFRAKLHATARLATRFTAYRVVGDFCTCTAGLTTKTALWAAVFVAQDVFDFANIVSVQNEAKCRLPLLDFFRQYSCKLLLCQIITGAGRAAASGEDGSSCRTQQSAATHARCHGWVAANRGWHQCE